MRQSWTGARDIPHLCRYEVHAKIDFEGWGHRDGRRGGATGQKVQGLGRQHRDQDPPGRRFDRGTVILRATAHNPISQRVAIKHPTVRVVEKDRILASSKPSGAVVKIPANGSVELPEIELAFNASSLLSTVWDLIRGGGTPEVQTVLFTALVTPVGKFDIPPIKDTVSVVNKEKNPPEEAEEIPMAIQKAPRASR